MLDAELLQRLTAQKQLLRYLCGDPFSKGHRGQKRILSFYDSLTQKLSPFPHGQTEPEDENIHPQIVILHPHLRCFESRFAAVRITTGLQRFQIARFKSQGQILLVCPWQQTIASHSASPLQPGEAPPPEFQKVRPGPLHQQGGFGTPVSQIRPSGVPISMGRFQATRETPDVNGGRFQPRPGDASLLPWGLRARKPGALLGYPFLAVSPRERAPRTAGVSQHGPATCQCAMWGLGAGRAAFAATSTRPLPQPAGRHHPLSSRNHAAGLPKPLKGNRNSKKLCPRNRLTPGRAHRLKLQDRKAGSAENCPEPFVQTVEPKEISMGCLFLTGTSCRRGAGRHYARSGCHCLPRSHARAHARHNAWSKAAWGSAARPPWTASSSSAARRHDAPLPKAARAETRKLCRCRSTMPPTCAPYRAIG